MPFNKQALIDDLKSCNTKCRIGFAASCCNRVLTSYKAFMEEAKWGDFGALASAVEYIWETLEDNGRFSAERLEQMMSECKDATPDLDEITTDLATWGHDAALVVLSALQCARDGTPQAAAEAASWSHASVDAFVQVLEDLDPADPALEQRIEAHPLMKRELAQIASDLECIRFNPELTTALVIQLRHAWQNDGRSNVDL
jgi:uncharacterized protein YjaG (DUF416 family)